jgi:Tfp pilus assembly protein PilZ
MRITSGGNVLVGTTTDTGERLQINGNVIGTNFAATASSGPGFTALLNTVDGQRIRMVMIGTDGAIDVTRNSGTVANLLLRTEGVERMRITGAGNVGIGTASPFFSRLHVTQTGAGLQDVVIFENAQTAAANVGSALNFCGIGTVTQSLIRSAWDGAATTDAYMSFGTRGSSTVQERMRITSGGNVLIGTTTDGGQKLQVAGDIAVLNTSVVRSDLFTASRVQFDNSVIISANSSLVFQTNGFNDALRLTTSYNVGMGQGTFGTSATRTFAITNGTAPTTSPADAFQMYSADVVAGNAAPHIRTENGAVVKVYQETTGVGNAAFVQGSVNAVYEDSTFDGYTLKQIVKALRNQGLLA